MELDSCRLVDQDAILNEDNDLLHITTQLGKTN